MTTISESVLIPCFDPSPDTLDRFLVFAAERAVDFLRRLGPLGAELGGQAQAILEWTARLLDDVAFDELVRPLTGPLFRHWQIHAVLLVRQADRPALREWITQLPRLLLLPALRARVPVDGVDCAIFSGQDGETELRLAGRPWHAVIPAIASGGTVRLRVAGDELTVACGERTVAMDVDALLTGTEPRLIRHAALPADAEWPIEIDASDPWVADYLAATNAEESPPPYPKRDLVAASPLPDGARQVYADALRVLAEAWPEMFHELTAHVQLVVPFTSRVLLGWTAFTQLGAIYIQALSTRPDDPVPNLYDESKSDPVLFIAERLVHEGSHTRLQTMTVRHLHEHSSADLLPSPVRHDPRPVTGVYHATFVYARVIEFMRRAARVTGRSQYAERGEELVPNFYNGLRTLRTKVKLTPTGNSLLAEVEESMRAGDREVGR